jgi:polyhydroxybutyrate depolymerase
MEVDGRSRYYLLNLPPNYEGSGKIPLVIFLHGAGGQVSQAEKDYHFTDKGNNENFAVVYPEGVQSEEGLLHLRYWNAGGCCKYAMDNNIDDVKFIRLLIDELLQKYPNLDSKKIYATGISNGAMMCYRLAVELSDKIAAIAPVSGTMMLQPQTFPPRGVPILHIHSLLDTIIPYYGGVGLGDYNFQSVDATLEIWASMNACNPTPQTVAENDQYIQTRWVDCKDNVIMECYATKDGGHAWPGGEKSRAAADEPSTAINANDIIWDFFKQYCLP